MAFPFLALLFAGVSIGRSAAAVPPPDGNVPGSSASVALTLAMIVEPPGLFAKGSRISPGDNAQAHASFDTTENCRKCHDPAKGNEHVVNELCTSAGCHADDIGRHQANKKHFHGSRLVLDKTCGECHTDHQGLSFNMVNDKNPKAQILGNQTPASAWGVAMQRADGTQKNWNHDLTGYKLIGGHKIDCDKCHKLANKRPNSQTRTWLNLSQVCLDCHENYHHFPKGDKFEDCLLCHTFISWKDLHLKEKGFDHGATAFPLRGAHVKVACSAAGCHVKGAPFAPVAHDTCETCHLKDSPHGKTFTTHQCTFCHTENTWKSCKVSAKEHKSFAKYDAQGAHGRLGCTPCHKGLKTTISTPGAQEGTCTACHNNIHGEKWMQSAKVCTKCHNQERWSPLGVTNQDHATWAQWNLLKPGGDPKESFVTSKHMSLQCVRCHPDLETIPIQHDCAFCHEDFHLKVDKQTKGAQCEQCHSTIGWESSGMTSFDHNKTKFPLTGGHKTVACEKCHPEMKAGQPAHKVDMECKACHDSSLVHFGKLPLNCEKCHITDNWVQTDGFDHNRDSRFKLVGRHAGVGCFVCHPNLAFKPLPVTCEECHSDYHKGAWGTIGCKECHNEKRWQVDKHTLVFQSLHNYGEVVLSGAHERIACEVCHDPNPRWLMSGFGGECDTCHVDVHLGSRGQECFKCHGQNQWLPAEFDHSSTGFPLVGTHRLVGCQYCHKGNLYAGLPDECVFCHTADGQVGHKGQLGLNGDLHCQDCHIPTSWRFFLTTGRR